VSVDSRPYGPGALLSLIYLHEFVKTVLSGRPFIMTAKFPDPPKSVKSLMRLCYLKKYDNYLPDHLMTRSKEVNELGGQITSWNRVDEKVTVSRV
jgi:hypothetical protein